jgi:ABC-type bacteriocin/lantibiotic exporter with double-glycine peptidase domain
MIKLKPHKQSKYNCGPASLKMVLEYFGTLVTEKELAKVARTNKAGTKGKNLVSAAKKYGYEAFIKDGASLNDLKKFVKNNIPVIVNWFSVEEDHYSAVVNLDDKYVYLIDPEDAKLKKIKFDTFKRIWFGFDGDYLTKKDDLVLRRIIVIKSKK